MARDRMQKQRFELKYLINEERALLVRDFVRSYLDFDRTTCDFIGKRSTATKTDLNFACATTARIRMPRCSSRSSAA
jgi:hypothetical protein